MEKFELPYLNSSNLDSNSLVFYNTRTFDTSSLLYLKHEGTETRGVYYEILPNYHNSINSFAFEKNQLLFFDGYSFTIDSGDWARIKNFSLLLLAKDSSFNINLGCRGCEEYALFFNHKSSKADYKSDSMHIRFINLVKKLFLDDLIKKRGILKSSFK